MDDPRIDLAAQTRSRIATLRAAMQRHGLSAWIAPSSDPHLSEYLPERWQSRAWLSGFTGSVGTLVVTADFAGLWIDSRYWVQADVQLAESGVATMRIPGAGSTAHVAWLAEHLERGATVGFDATIFGAAAANDLAATLATAGIAVRSDLDLLEDVWPRRPALPTAAVYEHLAPYAPTSRADKLAQLRGAMAQALADTHLISTLDDIAWLLNLRGADVPYNPVFVAHALVHRDPAAGVQLFTGEGKVPQALAQRLASDGVAVMPYAQIAAALQALPAGCTLLLDPRRTTLGLRQSLPASVRVVEQINPTTLAKSRKTKAEAAHVREAMAQDGAALARFFAWFEGALGRERITELTIDERITAARAADPLFVSPSFGTIAAFNGNGAMPHYRALPQSHAVIEGNGLLLIDSGGQYQNGTTDITRVVPVGTLNAEQRRDYTRVLQGMITLSMAVFPRGTRSPTLDVLARSAMWQDGVDYGHGTGHGVGYFMNVHEGPHGITPHLAPEPQTAMEPGMITSNEPGIYRPGKWGVRIENLVLNVPAFTTEFGEFLKFETLTLCPIDTRCIELSLLTEPQRQWLNDYHAEVRKRLAPRLDGDALRWLETRTAAL